MPKTMAPASQTIFLKQPFNDYDSYIYSEKLGHK